MMHLPHSNINKPVSAPLLTIEQRNQALEDGYAINQQYKCIDINSYRAMQEAQAQREIARSPEALARKKAEDEAHDARNAKQREARQAEKDAKRALRYELRLVEINSASANVGSFSLNVSRLRRIESMIAGRNVRIKSGQAI